MMFVVIVANILAFTVAASIQSIISGAADPTTQGRTMGAVSGAAEPDGGGGAGAQRAAARRGLAPAARRLADRHAVLLLRPGQAVALGLAWTPLPQGLAGPSRRDAATHLNEERPCTTGS